MPADAARELQPTRAPAPQPARPGVADRRLAGLVHVALAACATGILALHVLRPDLDPRTRYMSEYASGAHAWVMQGVFFTLGVASILLARPWGRHVRETRSGSGAWSGGLLAAWGAGMASLALFPGTGDAPAFAQAAHLGVLYAAEAALVVAILPLFTRFREPAWQPFLTVTLLLGVAAGSTHAAVHVLGWMPHPGLAQRVAGVAAWTWLVLAAARVRRA